MNSRINILGVLFHHITMKEAVARALHFLDGNEKRVIFTANPEIVMLAEKDKKFCETIDKGDLVVADGIGVVIGAKWLGKPLPERVAGYDLVQNIFENIKDTEKTVYFFGAGPGVAKTAVDKMTQKHKGLKVAGVHDGYFDAEEELSIIEEINRIKPDLLLVGLGAPKQELWINKYKDVLNVRLFVGVGGSFDVMSGNLKRAPQVFIRFGLEWLHRLLSQPTRIKRMIKLPLFLVHVVRFRLTGK